MRVLLAGATGVIGRRVVPLLRERGYSVTGFVRRDADADWLRSLGAEAVRGDVFDADGVRRAVALAAPDVVMHQLTDLKGGNRPAALIIGYATPPPHAWSRALEALAEVVQEVGL